jgi:uncharacterized membrane protein YhaH (DUF805 family)
MFWWLKCMKQFADFKGRARRKEYWIFTLFNYVISTLLLIVLSYIGFMEWGLIIWYVMQIPGLAVGVRRVHDVGKSGWILLIPIYNLILLLKDGDKFENKYGPDPKAI